MIGTCCDEIPFAKVPELHQLKLNHETTNVHPWNKIIFITAMYYHVPCLILRQTNDLCQLNVIPQHPTIDTIIANLPIPHVETKAS